MNNKISNQKKKLMEKRKEEKIIERILNKDLITDIDKMINALKGYEAKSLNPNSGKMLIKKDNQIYMVEVSPLILPEENDDINIDIIADKLSFWFK